MVKKCFIISNGLWSHNDFHTNEVVGSLASHPTIQNLSIFCLKNEVSTFFFFLSHLASPLYRERRKNEVCFPHRVGLHKPEAGPIASFTADRSAPAQSFTVLSMAALCYNGRVEFLNMNYKA